jgi:L-fuconate dehydratase
LDVRDIRFPTSRELDGSDAMNPDPDYSAAYVVVGTDDPDWPTGHGLTFTIGRGTEVVVAAVEALRPHVLGRDAQRTFDHIGEFWRDLVGDSQLRWIGPEKGAMHLATAAVVTAVWDLWAKREGKQLWQLLADLPPERIVEAIDFRYIDDALSPAAALARLERNAATRAEREAEIRAAGYPAYNTSVGWLGYSDEKIQRLCRDALADGWTRFKMKVGADVRDDRRRAGLIRREIGPEFMLAMDANQRWGVNQAIAWMAELSEFRPYWIEEPTNPDDILGHARIARAVAPIKVATGEHAHNRVMFKQLLQAGSISICQIDACRLGGVNEVLAVLLLAAEFGVPVCPHAGGVGLCELVQHLAIFDYLCVSATLDGRMIEYVDHLHEHFVDPVVIRDGRYLAPTRPGYSAEMRPESLARFAFPDGTEWRALTSDGFGPEGEPRRPTNGARRSAVHSSMEGG